MTEKGSRGQTVKIKAVDIQSLSQVYLVEMSDKESTERKHKRGESIANPRRGVGR